MGRLEVQGIVSVRTGQPLVQFRQIDDDGTEQAMWQAPVLESREMAQQILEAAMNAVYDAALVTFAEANWPGDDDTKAALLIAVRTHRADTWGLPDQPEDWRP